MFNIVSDKFFIPLASPNKQIYWECICKLFGIMNHQLSFGIERDVLVEELQYYFEQEHAIEIEAEDIPIEEEETETPIEEQEIDDNSDESEKETEENESKPLDDTDAPPEMEEKE